MSRACVLCLVAAAPSAAWAGDAEVTLEQAWSAFGQHDSGAYGLGFSIAGGDINGDGLADLIVGELNGQDDYGAVGVWLGSSHGFSNDPDWWIEEEEADVQLGSQVGAADVNGDGFDDVLVHVGDGGILSDVDTGDRVVVFYGGIGGPDARPSWASHLSQATVLAIAAAGDVNADGYDDVVLGAPDWDKDAGDVSADGAAFVFHGSPTGLGTDPSWQAVSPLGGARFGAAVASAGDVNGDGFPDVVVGSPELDRPTLNEGAAFVFLGSATGLESKPAWRAESNSLAARLGSSVAAAGDVNGDGFDDLLVGADGGWITNKKDAPDRAFLFLGSNTGPSRTYDWLVEGTQAGTAIAGAGDVNADGLDDVLLGAPDYSNVEIGEGQVLLYLGAPDGLTVEPGWQFESGQFSADLGRAVASAGDVNLDGYDDISVGAWSYSADIEYAGAVTVFFGGP